MSEVERLRKENAALREQLRALRKEKIDRDSASHAAARAHDIFDGPGDVTTRQTRCG